MEESPSNCRFRIERKNLRREERERFQCCFQVKKLGLVLVLPGDSA